MSRGTLSFGLSGLNLPSRFAGARERIILHAVVYANFARSEPYAAALRKALSRPGFKRLDVIRSKFGPAVAQLVRYGQPEQVVRKEFMESDVFLSRLQDDAPEKVFVHEAVEPPCLPVLIVDDLLYFGQYARSSIFAPDGFWFGIQTKMADFFSWFESGVIPDQVTAEQLAAFRIVCECARCITR